MRDVGGDIDPDPDSNPNSTDSGFLLSLLSLLHAELISGMALRSAHSAHFCSCCQVSMIWIVLGSSYSVCWIIINRAILITRDKIGG